MTEILCQYNPDYGSRPGSRLFLNSYDLIYLIRFKVRIQKVTKKFSTVLNNRVFHSDTQS